MKDKLYSKKKGTKAGMSKMISSVVDLFLSEHPDDVDFKVFAIKGVDGVVSLHLTATPDGEECSIKAVYPTEG